MILRRFMKHVTDQNWFAVGLDVIVVIVGIFLGLQVQAWNEGRQAALQEKEILPTLRAEVESRLTAKTNELETIKTKHETIASALTTLFELNENSGINGGECDAVWQSHILEWNYLPLVSLDEIVASGNLDLISSEALRLQLMEYSSAVQAFSINTRMVRTEANKIVDDYPNILVRAWQGDQSTVSCKLDLMKADQSFLNALQSNHGRMGGLVLFTQRELDLLNSIKELLPSEGEPTL